MSNFEDQNHKSLLSNVTDNAEVANAEAPVLPQFRPLKSIRYLSWIIQFGNTLFEKDADALPRRVIQFLQGFLYVLPVLNRPGHARIPLN
jgi:hypothetical protein